jgi:hypothetical protein
MEDTPEREQKAGDQVDDLTLAGRLALTLPRHFEAGHLMHLLGGLFQAGVAPPDLLRETWFRVRDDQNVPFWVHLRLTDRRSTLRWQPHGQERVIARVWGDLAAAGDLRFFASPPGDVKREPIPADEVVAYLREALSETGADPHPHRCSCGEHVMEIVLPRNVALEAWLPAVLAVQDAAGVEVNLAIER